MNTWWERDRGHSYVMYLQVDTGWHRYAVGSLELQRKKWCIRNWSGRGVSVVNIGYVPVKEAKRIARLLILGGTNG